MGKCGSYFFASVAVALLLGGCASIGEVEGRLGEEVSLRIGQSVVISGENLEITFVEVLEDSRCPKDVVCVWEGRVRLTVEINENGSSNRVMLSQPGLTDQSAVEEYGEYQLAFKVEPYPEAGEPTAADEYRLLLTVHR